jgi:hypothetical protein
MMISATPFLPFYMDGYGLKSQQMRDLTIPFCLKGYPYCFQEIWMGAHLPEIVIRATGRRPKTAQKNMDTSYKATGMIIIKQACILMHIHPYF